MKVRDPLMTPAGHLKSAFRLPGGGSRIYKVAYYCVVNFVFAS
ncbi:Uncharacterized protein dnm_060830 [Desulfonema magnum]|uniref:Uncharacterized protein n=1 Tax=Desulfonema magnum TaxID=45655 RepID=A0A975BR16_9BACT|nr:Uncharacterized protein dnm_060830 [Desulfonema magnum]